VELVVREVSVVKVYMTMFVQGCSDVHVSSSVHLISGVPTPGNS
jgi:hypothetical protein